MRTEFSHFFGKESLHSIDQTNPFAFNTGAFLRHVLAETLLEGIFPELDIFRNISVIIKQLIYIHD